MTDRPGERLFVHHLDTLPAVQLWTVEHSDRLWAMHHETYRRRSSLVRFHPGVAKARELLNARYADRITLDELATAAGLSKFHLVRSFTQECGLAPHAYQNLRRVVDAKLRIERGESIKEAATSTGFADQAHFSRVFKRIVGVPPGAWSKAVRPTKTISCASSHALR